MPFFINFSIMALSHIHKSKSLGMKISHVSRKIAFWGTVCFGSSHPVRNYSLFHTRAKADMSWC